MPGRRRALVQHLQDAYRVSERRGCMVLRFDRSSHRYRSQRDDQVTLPPTFIQLPLESGG